MRIVFLDIDGVLNAGDLVSDAWNECFVVQRLVARLNRISQTLPDVRFVMSTSWRSCGYEYVLEKTLMPAGFIGTVHTNWRTPERDIIRKYPTGTGVIRGDEVHTWLVNNSYDWDGDRHVILDDMPDFHHDQPLVQTDADIGVSESDISRAISLLSD